MSKAQPSPELDAIPEFLQRVGEHLDDDQFAAIVAFGPAAVPPLVQMLVEAEARKEPWNAATENALSLLGDLADESALPVLLNVLREIGEDFELVDGLVPAFQHVGDAAFPGLLDLLDEVAAAGDDLTAELVADVLVRIGCKDERLFTALTKLLDTGDPILISGMLVELGDARAVPFLGRALNVMEFDPHDHSLQSNAAILEVADAIEALGGPLSPGQTEKMMVAHRARKKYAVQARMRDTGRNDACWCGSGRKYKKCCLAADQAAT